MKNGARGPQTTPTNVINGGIHFMKSDRSVIPVGEKLVVAYEESNSLYDNASTLSYSISSASIYKFCYHLQRNEGGFWFRFSKQNLADLGKRP